MGDAAVRTGESSLPDLTSHLQSILPAGTRPELINSVIPSLVGAVAEIGDTLRASHQVSLAGTANAFGDDQLNVDVSAESALRAALSRCPAVTTASSEEDPVERSARTTQDPDDQKSTLRNGSAGSEQYTVAFDPLDGSSIIAPNWSVGTITGVWDGLTALTKDPATKLVASVLGVFGPRTTAIVAVRVPGAPPACFEVGITPGLADAGENLVLRTAVQLARPPFKTRYFAPANLRAAAEEPAYASLVSRFIAEKWTLRYSGGLVPDLVHALVKGHGVYISPTTNGSAAKLRRLYELCPVALVIECAGGKAVDSSDGKDVLGRAVLDCDERGGLVCGNAEDVDEVMRTLLQQVS